MRSASLKIRSQLKGSEGGGASDVEADSAREAGRSAPAGAAECVGDLFFWLSGDLVMAGEVILEIMKKQLLFICAYAYV